MNPVHLIAKKRDGQTHTPEELEFIANGAATGHIPDYQLAAWLMAAFLNPLNSKETADLTIAMANSGERLDLTGLPKPWVDKHSTGGVGDKTTLVVLPLLAACGITMVKMSGRGLGITGGTVDKLESVPGFRTDLTPVEMKAQALKIGIALTGQTPSLAPADKALYALRDVTATVPSLPLIVSSILSKKIAGGAETIVLDVKCGKGAFMSNFEEASKLSQALSNVGTQAGLNIKIHITDMDQPLGQSAGNAIEVKEAIRILAGKQKGRFADLCKTMAVTTLQAVNQVNAAEIVEQAIQSGKALNKAKDWFKAQGADLSVFESENWQVAPVIKEIVYQDKNAFIEEVDAKIIGQLVVDLGGGRKSKTDTINHTVGIETLVEIGDNISTGTILARLHLSSDDQFENTKTKFLSAIKTSSQPIPARPVILQ